MKRVSILLSLIAVLLISGMAWGRIGGGDIVFKPEKGKGVTFSHDFHVKDLGLTCQKCHPSLFTTKERDKPVKMAEMYQGKSCGACHNGKDAFAAKGNCSKCHK
jgi:c(7)-type cytochrome triheme protein